MLTSYIIPRTVRIRPGWPCAEQMRSNGAAQRLSLFRRLVGRGRSLRRKSANRATAPLLRICSAQGHPGRIGTVRGMSYVVSSSHFVSGLVV